MGSSLVDLNLVVKEFFESRWDGKSPLLIAYSGGPDSRALLHAALNWGKAEIHLAHVDHGWREESAQEAALLEREANELGVSFHLKRLEKKTGEEEARELRLAFFASLKKEIPYQAVLMGHQANDLAETALKRLFEGAHLTRLFGMRQESVLKGVLIWRPLLRSPRKVIEEYLAKKEIYPLLDPSNRDPLYLRARMRLSLLPRLEESFGKGIMENLQMLAERSLELDAYLTRRVGQMRSKVARGPFGIWIDGNGSERIELRYLLLEEEFLLSRDVLETLLNWVEAGKGGEMSLGKRRIIADRGHLFFLADPLPKLSEPILLPPSGWARSGDWSVFVSENGDGEPSGWRLLWQTGSASVYIPENGEFWLSSAPSGISWKEKTPPFLRKICPYVLGQRGLVGNFLNPQRTSSGKQVKIFYQSQSFVN